MKYLKYLKNSKSKCLHWPSRGTPVEYVVPTTNLLLFAVEAQPRDFHKINDFESSLKEDCIYMKNNEILFDAAKIYAELRHSESVCKSFEKRCEKKTDHKSRIHTSRRHTHNINLKKKPVTEMMTCTSRLCIKKNEPASESEKTKFDFVSIYL